MVYIGMKPTESTLEVLQRELDIAYRKRKEEQVSDRAARPYEKRTGLRTYGA